MEEKKCSKCGKIKPVGEFYKNKEYVTGITSQCKKCHSQNLKRYYRTHRAKFVEKARKWRKANPEKHKNSQAKSDWKKQGIKINLEGYNQLFVEQKGCCAICGKSQKEFKRRFCVDHNHETGQVRGLLCAKCNHILGIVNDSRIQLQKASKYLHVWENKSER